MTLSVQKYLERKAEIFKSAPLREECLLCRKPKISCYCEDLAPFASDPRFVILMHPLEAKHPVGTGRMAHRSLSNSQLWVAPNFENFSAVNELIADPKVNPLLLFPGPQSVDISRLGVEERRTFFAPAPGATGHERRRFFAPDPNVAGRETVVIVLDATWTLAKKTLRLSPNLQRLPRICFTPTRPSQFLVRKQPHELCFSTIEAIHEVLRLLNPASPPERDASLLEIFDKMVAKQLHYRLHTRNARHTQSYFARKARRQKYREAKKQRLSAEMGAENSLPQN